MATKTIAQTIRSFGSELRSYKLPDPAPDEILEKINKLKDLKQEYRGEAHLKAFFEKRQQLLDKLAKSYLASLLSAKMPRISRKLFDLQRHIVINTTKDEIVKDLRHKDDEKNSDLRTINCPLFHYVPFADCTEVVELGAYERTKSVRRRYSAYDGSYTERTRTRYKLIAQLPKPPVEIEIKANQALVTLHQIYSKIFQEPALSTIFKKPKTEELGVIWIPSRDYVRLIKETKTSRIPNPPPVRSLDPALILTVDNNMFLSATWNIKEEENYENLLREFTSGDLTEAMKK